MSKATAVPMPNPPMPVENMVELSLTRAEGIKYSNRQSLTMEKWNVKSPEP